MNDILQAVERVGFPAAVSIWMMWYLTMLSKRLVEIAHALADIREKLNRILTGGDDR